MNGLSFLLRDRRGAGTLQMLILAVGLALGGLVAARALGGAASDRTECAGEQVAAFGGAVPCAGDSGGGGGEARPPEAPPAPEANGAPEPKELDPAEELKNLALELLGVTDAIDCFTKGDIMACVFTALSLSPFKAIGIAVKLAKNAKRIQNAVERFLAAKRAKEKADDARRVAEEAASKCKGGKCDKPGVCFAPGTPVHTERGLVAIEELQAGDLVLSRDDTTGEEAYRPIARTFVTPDQPLLAIALEDSRGEIETLEVTAPHPFQVEGRGWVAAGDLQPGDQVISSGGGHLRVTGNAESARSTTVYNFEVEDFHTYFVGVGAAWVHNQGKADDCSKPDKAAAQKELDEIEEKLKDKSLSGKQKRELRDRKKQLKEQLGEGTDEATEAAEKAVRDKLGDLEDIKDMRADEAIRSRGGNASNVREALGNRFRDATVEDIARLAAQGDAGAEKALKIIKQAAQKGQDH